MSIERMESVLLVAPAGVREPFLDWLYRERQVHVEDIKENDDRWTDRFRPVGGDAMVADTRCGQLQMITEFFHEVHKTPSDFLESLFPVKTIAKRVEVEKARDEVQPEQLAAECQKLRESIQGAQDERLQLQTERTRLDELSFLTVPVTAIQRLQTVSVHFVFAGGQAVKALPGDARFTEQPIVLLPLVTKNSGVVFALVGPKSQEELLLQIVTDYALRELVLPAGQGTIAEATVALDKRITRLAKEEAELRAQATALAVEWDRRAGLALAYWESERTRVFQQESMANSDNVVVIRGYIRSGEREAFVARMAKVYPAVHLVTVAGYENEEPPVSLHWGKALRPAGLLVKMFGVPSYRGIDPTAFLAVTFFTFFGICFGDVLYGLMLLGTAAYLKRRFHDQAGLVEFFRLFTYAGVSTIIFGFAMGSWGADLPAWFGKDNVVDRLRVSMTLLDPLKEPVKALMIAVSIGVVNQLYGIFMRFLRDMRRGDIASAIYDGVFWIIYLVSLMVYAIGASMGAPKSLLTGALIVFGFSAVGLVLTQGRDEKGWPARLITGVVSLYGIMGTYGTTAFIGDVVSYSRLMALGMTTSVVGMSFNIIADMLRDIPYVGWVFFFIMIIFGHIFNYVMCILGAFVHSARLILLEWFGRFYEGGGTPFRPYGFASARLDQVD